MVSMRVKLTGMVALLSLSYLVTTHLSLYGAQRSASPWSQRKIL